MAKKDYYTILGVSKDAATEDVKRAYREKAKKQHPDTGGCSDDGSFKRLTEAYNVLRDKSKRAKYDESHRDSQTKKETREAAPFSDSFHYRHEFLFGRRRSVGIRRMTMEMVLTPSEAATGGVYMVPIPETSHIVRCFGLREDMPRKRIPLKIPPGIQSNSRLTFSLESIGFTNTLLEVFLFVE